MYREVHSSNRWWLHAAIFLAIPLAFLAAAMGIFHFSMFWLALLFGIPLVIFMISNPEKGVFLLPLIYTLEFITIRGVGSKLFYLFHLSMLLLVFSVFFRVFTENMRIEYSRTKWLILFIFVGALLVTIRLDNISTVFHLSFRDIIAAEYGLSLIAFLLIYNMVRTESQIQQFFIVFIFALIVLTTLSYIQHFSSIKTVYDPVPMPISSSWASPLSMYHQELRLFEGKSSNPNNTINLYILAIPFIFSFFLYSRGVWRKVLCSIILSALFGILILAQARSAILGILLVFLVMPFLGKRVRKKYLTFSAYFLGLLLLVFVTWILIENITPHRYQSDSIIERGIFPRIHQTQAVLKLIRHYPLGLNESKYLSNIPKFGGNPWSPHNIFLYHTIYTGWLGGLGFLGIITFIFVKLLKAKPPTWDNRLIIMRGALLCGLIAYIIHNLAHNLGWEYSLWMFLALCMRYIEIIDKSNKSISQPTV